MLHGILRIEGGELKKTAFFFLAFLSGVSSLILGRTIGDTLFLSRSNPFFLPYLYIGTALLTGLISTLYSSLLARVSRSRLIPGIAILFLLSVISMRFLFPYRPSVFYPFFVIWVEVYGTVLILQFWIVANNAFTSREARRLFPIITAGGLLGNILCGLSVHSIVHTIGTENLLFLCAAIMVLYIVFLLPFLRDITAAQGPSRHVSAGPRRWRTAGQGLQMIQTSGDLLRSRYLRQVGGVILFTYLVSTLVDYQFKMTLKDTYAEEGMAAFFGRLYAVIGALSFFLQFFLTTRILERLGVLPSLLLLPVSLFFGSLGFFLRPVFPIAVGAKSADLSLRYTVQYASLQILYLPFSPGMKERVTALLDGIIKPLSMGCGGLVLLALTHFLTLGRIGLVGSALALLWVLLTISLRRGYIASLLMTLREKRLDPGSATALSVDSHTTGILLSVLDSADENQVLYALDLLSQAGSLSGKSGKDLEARLPSLASHSSPRIRAKALSLFPLSGGREHLPLIEKGLLDPDPEVKEASVVAMSDLGGSQGLSKLQGLLGDRDPRVVKTTVVCLITRYGIDGFFLAGPILKTMLESADEGIRGAGAQALGEIGIHHFYQPLISLLDDPSPKVRKEAILAGGRIKNLSLAVYLLPRLSDRHLRAATIQALSGYGDAVLDLLRSTLETEGDLRMRMGIPRVLATIGTQKALGVLMGCLKEQDHGLRQSIIRGISSIHAKHPPYRIPRQPVEERLMETLGEYYRTLFFHSAMGEEGAALIRDTLRERMDSLLEEAFLLLGILYPSRMVATISANIKSQVPAERANAVEILDTLLSRGIKAVLLPIIEDHPLESRIGTGCSHFHLHTMTRSDVLRSLVEEDHGWVRACALFTIGEEKDRLFHNYIVTASRDPDPIVRETALSVLAHWGPSPPEVTHAHNG